jgi:hypothetical protein
MRALAGLATVLISAAGAAAADAQTLPTSSLPTHSLPADSVPSASLAASDAAAEQLADKLNQAAFAPRSYAAHVDPAAMFLGHESYEPGAGAVRWTSSEVKLSNSPGGPVDALRISVGGAVRTPLGLPSSHGSSEFEAQAYEVALTRDWPGAVSFQGKGFGLDVSPHAGLGMTSLGGSAEAGATLELSKRDSQSETAAQRLKALGLRDGARFGDRGRWYLYAAASGRAVGWNMLHTDGGWDRAGWSQDATSTLVGDAQVGVGWRKGPVQTSLGYLHRSVKGQNMLWGVDPKDDSMVAFSLSIKPQR